MAKANIKSKKGFTIIEVVLVLAIAGLIFLMVFVALPALQRSQRDTQRRNDLGRAVTAIQNYQTNNNHKIPAVNKMNSDFLSSYLTMSGNESFTDPSGTDYKFYQTNGTSQGYTVCDKNLTNCGFTAPTEFVSGRIYAFSNATCSGETVKYVNGASQMAFVIKLEGAGSYCTHN